MEMNHFSHQEHPLILSQLPNKNDDHGPLLCYGCQEQILEVEAYSCLPCQFFLHKRCAELPKEIKHPMHSIHPLLLHKEPPYRSGECFCNACRNPSKFLTYHCSICEFDLHVSCAILDRSFEHDSHEHRLISLPRPAIFTCNACLTRSEGASYVCSICPFWIHKSCASLPKIMDYKDHDHSLSLAYSIPLEHRNFRKYCDVCHERTHLSDWCYYCGPCRYFIHLKCLASETKSTEGNVPISDGEPDCNLPTSQAAQELIKHFLLAGNESDIQIEEVISDFSHPAYPLTLCSINLQTQQNEAMIGKEVICDICIEPISNPDCYSCVDCGYFIHATCARLQDEIKILNHSEHPLLLSCRLSTVGFFFCNTCGRWSNGLFYVCEPCDLRFCIKCSSVSFAKTAAHSAHEHLLTSQAGNSNWKKCNACGKYRPAGFGFGCDKCHFYLCSECAFLPPSTKQRWDDHPLLLIYQAYYEHPDDFYCVMCEKEINPNHWMYHCRECDYSFHVWCIPQIRLFRNVKFGRTLPVDNHPDPLTHVHEAKHKSFCKGCSKRLDWKAAFECEPCKFYLCLRCAERRELRPADIVNPTDDGHSSQPDDGKELMLADHAEQHESTVSSSRWRTLKQRLIITRQSKTRFQ